MSFFGGTAHPSGASALAATGYNLQFGHLVTGLELSERFGHEQFSDSQFAVTSDPIGIIGQSTKTYQFLSDAGFQLSMRVGLAVEDTLIYAKAGVGAAHTTESLRSQSFGTACDFFSFTPTGTSCAHRTPFLTGTSSGTSAWLPAALLGLGIEQNFGPFFARIEGQAEAVRGASILNEWLWTTRAIGAVGFRF